MIWKRTKIEPASGPQIRLARVEELPGIMRMAGEFHGISRFFADDHFDRPLCKKLYELWIERDFKEEDHFLWVCEEGGQVTAYTSASLNKDEKEAEIGLVGVNRVWRGQGLGLHLQRGVLKELQQHDIPAC